MSPLLAAMLQLLGDVDRFNAEVDALNDRMAVIVERVEQEQEDGERKLREFWALPDAERFRIENEELEADR